MHHILKDKIAYVITVPQVGYYVAENTTQFINNSAQEKKKDTLKIELTRTSLLKNVAKENEISLEELILQNREVLDLKVKKGQKLTIIKESN